MLASCLTPCLRPNFSCLHQARSTSLSNLKVACRLPYSAQRSEVSRQSPASISAVHHTTLSSGVSMVSLTGVAGGVIALLAVIGAVTLAVLLFPELRSLPAAWLEKHLFPDPNQIMLKNRSQQNIKSSTAPRKVYRILAFGDSLTEGFTSGGSAFHPYAKKLGDELYKEMPKDWHLEIEEQGESGEHVLLGMNHRLQRTLDEHTAANRPYDWVLLLGGINDLAGDGCTAAEVMAGLDTLVQKCLQHGANVMLMTLLDIAMPEPGVEAQRQELNSLITDYVSQALWDKQIANNSRVDQQPAQAGQSGAAAASNSSQSNRRAKPQVYLFDLASAMPYMSFNEQERWELWDDGVHLTMVGYERMGGLIAESLVPLAKQELQQIDAAAGGLVVKPTATVDKKDQ